MDKVDWTSLCLNPNSIHILENNLDKVCWSYLLTNPNAIHLLFGYDYESIKYKNQDISKQIIEYVFNPYRLIRVSSKYNLELDEYLDII